MPRGGCAEPARRLPGLATTTDRSGRRTAPRCPSLFADLREQLSGDREILEVKHKVRRVLSVKTRAQITVEKMAGEKPVLAKGGIFVPGACRTTTSSC